MVGAAGRASRGRGVDLRLRHHNLELFFHCPKFSGTVTTEHVAGPGRLDAHYIKEARIVPRGELDRLSVYPPELKDEFWRDLAEGFPETRCLGLQSAFPGAPEGD